MFERLKEDLDSILERDPAARSRLEVYFLYSGFRAVRSHRKANWFYRHNMKFIARWISQRCRHKTGIEIHPAAKIGKGLFIDHGMGVVIGETAEVGDGCTIYQGVTLGGTGKDRGKRHPTLGKNVTVGCGAKILGPFQVGDGAKVAANAVLLESIPESSTAVGVPARVARVGGRRPQTLDHVHLPDPVAQEICRLQAAVDRLERRIRELEQETGVTISQRTPHGVTVTFAGEELLSHARIILEELEQIRRMAEGELLFCAGSLYLIGELRNLLKTADKE